MLAILSLVVSRVRRVALVTDSVLAPVAEFMANHVVGVETRHYPFAEGRRHWGGSGRHTNWLSCPQQVGERPALWSPGCMKLISPSSTL